MYLYILYIHFERIPKTCSRVQIGTRVALPGLGATVTVEKFRLVNHLTKNNFLAMLLLHVYLTLYLNTTLGWSHICSKDIETQYCTAFP